MPDFGLKVAIADTVKDLLGDTLEHRKSTSAAITPDGRVSPAAVAGALPWQAHDGKIEGTVTTGSNRLRWHFPQGGVIRQVSYDVRTAPSGGALEFTISGGSSTERFSLQAGQTSGVTNTGIVMPPGSWARVNILSANGAADLAVTLQYESAGTGSTVSGGGGGGGGGTISVISVNGQTGVVELNADDIDDTTTTHKFVSAAEKAKLASFEPGDFVLASSLALVATSGDYDDLDNTPTLGTAAAMDSGDFASAAQGARADTAVQPDELADVATSGDYEDLDNKPTIPAQFNPIAGTNMSITGTYPDITFSAAGGGGGGGAVDSVNGQTGIVVLDADDIDATANRIWMQPAERTKLSGIQAGAEANVQSDWDATSGDAAIINKPTEFPPEPHTHGVADLTATGSPGSTTYLRGDGTWSTPPNTNTTYSEIPLSEITAGTASTLRTISGRRAQEIVNKAREGLYTQAQVDAAIAAAVEFARPVSIASSLYQAAVTQTSTVGQYVTAISIPLSLDAGTWQIYGVAGGVFRHSGTNDVRIRVRIDSYTSGTRTQTMSSTDWRSQVVDVNSWGVPHNATVILEYVSPWEGTAYAHNPWMNLTAYRVS